MHVDGVHEPVDGVRGDHLTAELGQQRAERLVLIGQAPRVGCPPAGGGPVAVQRRTTDEHALERRAHGGDAVSGQLIRRVKRPRLSPCVIGLPPL